MRFVTKILLTAILLTGLDCFSQCWKAVSVGYSHTVAIAGNGTLWAWGLNHFGELGDGTTVSKNLPVQISTDTDWKSISAGSGATAFNLATKENGTLWSWGSNIYGQLGNGTRVNSSIPIQVGTDTDWSIISAGYLHALAIKNNGTLWSWGGSNDYALGFACNAGSVYDKLVPTQLGTDTWKSASAGDTYSVAVKTDGTTWGWGTNNGNPIGLNGTINYVCTPTPRAYNNTGVKKTCAGDGFSYDLKTANNLLVVWGNPVYGESGGTTCAGCPSFYLKDLACGDNTAAIIKNDNTLWFTGKKLGYTESTVQYTNTFLQLGSDNDWKSVAVGYQSGAAIKTDGSLYTWGWNYYGQLGIGTNGSGANSLTLVAVDCPSTLSTAQQQAGTPFLIYPNPAKNSITIESSKKIDKITITDMTAKIVLVQAGGSVVNVSSLAQGMYSIQIESENKISHNKFIKQ